MTSHPRRHRYRSTASSCGAEAPAGPLPPQPADAFVVDLPAGTAGHLGCPSPPQCGRSVENLRSQARNSAPQCWSAAVSRASWNGTVQTHDRAGSSLGHPEPVAQHLHGAALAVRCQKFPVMMVSGCRPEVVTPKFPGRSCAFHRTCRVSVRRPSHIELGRPHEGCDLIGACSLAAHHWPVHPLRTALGQREEPGLSALPCHRVRK